MNRIIISMFVFVLLFCYPVFAEDNRDSIQDQYNYGEITKQQRDIAIQKIDNRDLENYKKKHIQNAIASIHFRLIGDAILPKLIFSFFILLLLSFFNKPLYDRFLINFKNNVFLISVSIILFYILYWKLETTNIKNISTEEFKNSFCIYERGGYVCDRYSEDGELY